ncbi:hypothetical protein [Methylomonas rapida]|uniref:Uncharacterized protein n=1 Tax=Methylomonas rapida TaxID=2963939 RepID=A0ABY7GJY3_9GAMM|nr:hypothetical protein [Methylomonas rapida]WAR42943.1 hypothetical protein NM686_011065 [Methylomonas rapida]
MTLGLSTTIRNNRLQTIVDAFDAGTGSGKILLYTAGSGRPATGAAITDQVLLGTITLSDPCGTVTDGVLTFAAFTEDSLADATGDIAFARGVDSDGNFVLDMGCGVSGSGQELIFNTLSVQAGGVIQILSGSLTEGNA